MPLGEFFVEDLEKGLSDVGGYIFAVCGIIPNYFPLSILLSRTYIYIYIYIYI